MQRTEKTGLVFSKKLSSWKSAGIISQNIYGAYSHYLNGEFEVFHLSQRVAFDSFALRKLAEEVFKARPNRLVFIDDVVPAATFLLALDEVYGSTSLPNLYFHIYGNFTLQTFMWLKVENVLKKTKVHYVCASERQGQLMAKFLKHADREISICPFPVNASLFYQSPTERESYRKKFDLADDEFVLIYSGRLCLQKNILRLIKEFDAFLDENRSLKFKLLLVGKFEDGRTQFSLSDAPLGQYYWHFRNTLNTFGERTQNSIQYLGNQESEELRGLYNASDSFVSLGLYHDEDYGMAPAEALMCGLPVLLTDWGGFAGFDFSLSTSLPRPCHLVEVKLTEKGLELSSSDFRDAVRILSGTHFTDETRRGISLEVQQRISIEAIAGLLGEIHSRRVSQFSGYSNLMRRHAGALRFQPTYPQGPKAGTFYEKIYSSYLKPSGKRTFSAKSESHFYFAEA